MVPVLKTGEAQVSVGSNPTPVAILEYAYFTVLIHPGGFLLGNRRKVVEVMLFLSVIVKR